MNHLVTLDAQANELEKILSGVKTMLVKEYDPADALVHPINSDDSLYFLRSKDDCAVRVRATVLRVLFLGDVLDEDISHILKEMQSKLQLTEDQFNHWSTQKWVALVEFYAAQKIPVVKIAPEESKDRPNWMASEAFSGITK